jgi:hypothetical protein
MSTKKQTPKTAAASAVVASPASALVIFDRFRQISEVKPVLIHCKGWGEVYALALTVAETQAAQEYDKEPAKNSLAKAVMHTMCDADGKRIFDITNAEHMALVRSQPQDFLIDFLSKSGKALGTGQEGVDDAKKG